MSYVILAIALLICLRLLTAARHCEQGVPGTANYYGAEGEWFAACLISLIVLGLAVLLAIMTAPRTVTMVERPADPYRWDDSGAVIGTWSVTDRGHFFFVYDAKAGDGVDYKAIDQSDWTIVWQESDAITLEMESCQLKGVWKPFSRLCDEKKWIELPAGTTFEPVPYGTGD